MYWTNSTKKLELSYLRSLSPDNIIYNFFKIFEIEMLSRETNDNLKSYYKNFFKNRTVIPASVYAYGKRLEPMIKELINLKEPAKILDGGCGYGTESLLFSLLGHEVVGVDLVSERINIASSRIKFYQSFCNFPMKISFVNANIFSFLESSPSFDIIWLMESISHIYPPLDFLCLVHRKLKKRGKLIISDPNATSPLALLRSIKIRGSLKHSTHKKFKDPNLGIPVDYAQENIFTVYKMKKILEQIGFKINEISMAGYMGTSFIPKSILQFDLTFNLLKNLFNLLQKTPLVRLIGTVYTIVATKED